MKKIGITLFLVLFISNSLAGSYQWTKRMGNTKLEHNNNNTVDNSDNIFIVGQFRETVNFAGDWSGTDNKISAGYEDISITKINSDGSYGWTKRIGGSGISVDYGRGIITDNNGNVFVEGHFGTNVNFAEDWGGTNNKISAGDQDIFITKISNNANYCWTKRIGSTNKEYGESITVDNSGNIYFTGYFKGVINFEEDWGGTDNKTSAGNYDIFVTKINSDGIYSWTRRIGGSGNDLSADITVDNSGNVFVTGSFGSTVNFQADWGGTDNKTSAGGYDIFVTKINSNGTYGWAKKIGDTGNDDGNGLIVDNSGNVFVVGNFHDTVNFQADWGGTDNKTSAGNHDIFITKINSNGTYDWTRSIGGLSDDYGLDVTVDKRSNILVTGMFQSSINFAADWGGNDNRTSTGWEDIFIVKINFNGSYGWTRRIGGSFSDQSPSITVDSSDNVIISGSFWDIVNFAEDWGRLDNKTSAGIGDIFITKFKNMPSIPLFVSSVGISTNKIELSWNNVPDETHFFVYQNSTNNFNTANKIAPSPPNIKIYTHTGLHIKKKY